MDKIGGLLHEHPYRAGWARADSPPFRGLRRRLPIGRWFRAALLLPLATCWAGAAGPPVSQVSNAVAGTVARTGAATGARAPIAFSNTIVESKIRFALKNSVSPQRYSIETMAGGLAVFDYNNDGLLDIFFTNGAEIPSLEKTNASYANRLWRNNGDGTFTDVTDSAGLQGKGYSMGAAAADYDNDGFEDLYVTGVNVNQLFHNNGNGTFTDVTAKSGVGGSSAGAHKSWSVTAGWFDYDHDGRLDLLVVNYLDYDLHTAALCQVRGTPAYCSPSGFKGTRNILYRNNGDGTFTDVSETSHIAQYTGKGMGVAFADYDGDGFTDVFISNDTFQNYLLHNNGDGTFTDVAARAWVAYNGDGKTVAGMGAEFRDLDNDGQPDIFQTAMFGDGFSLFKNVGKGEFQDVTGPTGLTSITSRLTGWGTGAFDFDNDGNKDLFTANAAIFDNAPELQHRPYALPNGIFRNRGDFTFEDVSREAGVIAPAAHRGAAFGDFDNDGKIDVVVAVLNGPPELLMNRTQNNHHWITLRLIGKQSNRDGLGTKVRIVTANGSQYDEATTAVGYNSSSDKRVHFGLGDCNVVERIELSWPGGVKQSLVKVAADQILTVTEAAK